MSAELRAARAARPDSELHVLADLPDELVLSAGSELLRLPRTPGAVARHAVLARALPVLRNRLPVAVAAPRYVGVLADGSTPLTAEPRLPGEPLGGRRLGAIAVGQLAGTLAALREVPEREAQSWGVDGAGTLLHGDLHPGALLVEPRTGLLTGIAGWRLRLGEPEDDLALLPADVAAALR